MSSGTGSRAHKVLDLVIGRPGGRGARQGLAVLHHSVDRKLQRAVQGQLGGAIGPVVLDHFAFIVRVGSEPSERKKGLAGRPATVTGSTWPSGPSVRPAGQKGYGDPLVGRTVAAHLLARANGRAVTSSSDSSPRSLPQ